MEGEVGDKPREAVGDFVTGVADGGVDREREDGGEVRQRCAVVGGELRPVECGKQLERFYVGEDGFTIVLDILLIN